MLHRSAYFWLCCVGFEVDEVRSQFKGIEVRTKKSTGVKNKFGSYDYIFIDAPQEDMPIEFLLDALLDKLEPYHKVIAQLGDELTSAVDLTVKTSESHYSEAIGPRALSRLAFLNLQLNLKYECV